MPRFVIQQRGPGHFEDPAVPWHDIAHIEAPSVDAAIRGYCEYMSWHSVRFDHHVATVPGVGRYRAAAASVEQLVAFRVDRQAQPGPHDTHITWQPFDRIDAADERAAVREYCERQQWEQVSMDGATFRPYGLGLFRVVRMSAGELAAERAHADDNA